MIKYSAINIGPILETLDMARKPKELWAASYLFSHLMKIIIIALKDRGYKIVSPADVTTENIGVGLYPDRVFYEGEQDIDLIKVIQSNFANELNLPADVVFDYFNIMTVSSENNNASDAVCDLNHKLDCLELFQIAKQKSSYDAIRKFIREYEKIDFQIDDLGDIARNGVKNVKYSYSRYICIVQADGDNMGKVINKADNLSEVSKVLLDFGCNATKAIKEYSSVAMPVYAGGDDLLFIAPVCSGNKNIFDLIDAIDEQYKAVQSVTDKTGIKTTMSYGVSITYYKFPLYEALASARKQLDIAKKTDGKNAIVVDLRKHSGGAFTLTLSKNHIELKNKFMAVVEASSSSGTVVSAVAHKIRNNVGLLSLWYGGDDAPVRNKNFYCKYMEHKLTGGDKYKDATLDLLNVLYNSKIENVEILTQNMYGMLRIAKFIKGEELNNE